MLELYEDCDSKWTVMYLKILSICPQQCGQAKISSLIDH